MPVRILLMGGIGSGKSTAAEVFAEFGALVVNSDDVARDVLAPGTDAADAVLAMWPSAGAGGIIDRIALGRIVFADPAELAALEMIVHPATKAEILGVAGAAADTPVVVEMPILREWYDETWVRVLVDAPDELRISRVVGREPVLEESDVRAVMARQPTREQWLLAADYVLDNSGSSESLRQQVHDVWERIVD